jgi:septum formation protein
MQRKIVLASQSPRRIALLKQIGLKNFEIRPSEYEEDMQALDNPQELAKFLALKKAENVAQHYKNAIIIAGDTFVIFEKKFIGKPKSMQEAREVLARFSDKKHLLISGWAVIDSKTKQVFNDYAELIVEFNRLSELEIEKYLESTPMALGMAGAYNLMGKAAPFIRKVEGNLYATSLPINQIYSVLQKLKVDIY